MGNDVRQVVWSGGLALLGLGLAAWAWKGDAKLEVSAGKVPFVACGSGELEELALVAGARRVSVRFTADTARVALTRPVAHAPRLPGGVTPTETLEMAANARVARLRERYEPALAKRALGVVTPSRLPALGLSGPGRSREQLTITCGGQTQRFQVGTASYGGGGRYVQALPPGEPMAPMDGAAAGGLVWLVDPTLISDVRLADSRYVERRLVAASRTALASAEVRAYGKVRRLTHLNRRVLKDAEWVDAATPKQRNELYGNWLAKVLRLRAISWLAKGTRPGQDQRPAVQARPVMQARFAGDVTVSVALMRGTDAKGQALFWARSESTGGWVTVSRTLGQQIVDDLATVVGAPPPASKGPAARGAQATPPAAVPAPTGTRKGPTGHGGASAGPASAARPGAGHVRAQPRGPVKAPRGAGGAQRPMRGAPTKAPAAAGAGRGTPAADSPAGGTLATPAAPRPVGAR